MTDDVLDAIDMATVGHVAKCDGGFLFAGKVWTKIKNEETGDEEWLSKTRLHVCTSDTAVAKLVKDYLRANIRNENGVLDEDDGA